MEATSNGKRITEREIVAGLKVIETEYRVERPVYEDVVVQRAVFEDKKVEVPVGLEETIKELAKQIYDKLEAQIDGLLAKAITKRIAEIEQPKVVYKDFVIEKPIFRQVDVPVDRVKFVDREVINPVIVDKQVTNAVIKDVEVERPVYKERVVPVPKFEEVIIQKPKWVDKEVTAIHLKYVDPKGNPENA